MKIEVDVPQELIEKLGQEAVQSYLARKAKSLYQSVIQQSTEVQSTATEDKEAAVNAWQKFNKRGMSC